MNALEIYLFWKDFFWTVQENQIHYWENNSTVCSYESVVDLENPIYLLWKELMWKVEDSQRRVSGTTQPNGSRQQQTDKTNVRRKYWQGWGTGSRWDYWAPPCSGNSIYGLLILTLHLFTFILLSAHSSFYNTLNLFT